MKDLRSPLSKVKGLGTSNEASQHFWLERITALALIPLVIWFCLSIALLPTVSYEVLVNWLHSPFNTTMMILIVIVGFQHAQLGMQVIIEDYIASYTFRISAILVVKFISYFLMALGVYSILKIALSASTLTSIQTSLNGLPGVG